MWTQAIGGGRLRSLGGCFGLRETTRQIFGILKEIQLYIEYPKRYN
jgi:hypothetical protein